MSLYQQLVLGGVAGCLLGWLQFRGLWETLRRLPGMAHPELGMLTSLLLRMTVLLVGLGLLARHGGWQTVLAALVGMLGMRFYLQRRLAPGTAAWKRTP